MKTLIFDGSPAGDLQATRIRTALLARLPDAETVILREQRIGNCAGDFLCWVRSPGVCKTDDDNPLLAARVMQSDLLVYLTPVRFGGYSSCLKRIVDHQIQNVLPFFTTIHGEIHHKPRYHRYPDLLALGWMPDPDAQSEAIFRHLVWRNAINMHARSSGCGVLVGTPDEADLAAQIGLGLEALERFSDLQAPSLPRMAEAPAAGIPPRRALLLVGSPRTKASTSASLGGFLFEHLALRGVQTETLQVYPAFSSPERTARSLEKSDAADLVVLAFPLYVDSLPAPLIAALEKIAEYRAGRSSEQRFAAIANCGFPEASHNAPALAICSEFARQSGFTWAGGLALGGGQGIVHGMPLDALDGRALPIKKSLKMAAAALANGESIPGAAGDLLARPAVPSWLYLLFGAYGWRQQAKRYGVQRQIKNRPYEPVRAGR
ncbi:MAG: hypothetical protein A2Z37_04335 [Chloroflexi bacterium RBG_19FT_COMBO_62_14]|nr:MAG: hypothetical protein A2Z37_04335 [Chloroflexi bacterium RBG_19FT_COMBO_62_14]